MRTVSSICSTPIKLVPISEVHLGLADLELAVHERTPGGADMEDRAAGRYPIELTTPRLRLLRWSEDDAGALRAALDDSDAHLRPWIPFMEGEPRSLVDTRARLRGFADDFRCGRHFRYAVWTRAGHVLIGEVMLLDRVGPGALEVGYWLHVSHGGRGHGREAVQGLVDAAFADRELERLVFRCDVQNVPSNAIPRRLGANIVDTEAVSGGVMLHVWVLGRVASPTPSG